VATSFWSLSSHAFAVRIDKKKHEINSKPSSPRLSPILPSFEARAQSWGSIPIRSFTAD
jgi:hypothetical protein